MRSVVGPLLFGLGLLWVTGCALPGQQLSQSDRLEFKVKERPKPGLSDSELDVDKLTFKSPNRRSKTAANENKTEIVESTLELSRPDSTVSHRDESFELGHSVERLSTTMTDEQITPAAANDEWSSQTLDTTKVRALAQADNQESRNSSGVTLEGVEADDGPTKTKSRTGPNTQDRHPLSRPDSANRSLREEARNWADRLPELRPSQRKLKRGTSEAGADGVDQATHSELMQTLPKVGSRGTNLSWQADLEQLIARVEQDLARSRTDDSAESFEERQKKQIYLRLLYMMAQRQEQALTAIPELSENQQEYWQQMIWAMSNSLDTTQFPDTASRAAQTIAPLSTALRQMREEASLSIKNISFCRKISYFGNYERFQRNEFTPGQEVLLYCEVENFVSVPTTEGEYRTSLKSLIEIVDPKGKIVWTKAFPATEDFCRNPRRDYFHNYQFRIPEDIAMGTYSLKLSITDELSQKKVANSLTFVLK